MVMRREPSRLIAIICALLLLGAQQAAYVHWISHIGAAASATSAPDRGNNSDDHNALSHACMTCAAFAALNAAPPTFIAPMALVHAAARFVPDIPHAHLPALSASPYSARAPPALL